MSPAPVEKSVITCDLEGRIETFNEGAARMFGWRPDEIIGKKRVSLFSPGLVVLGHVGAWLATAQKQGEYRGRTVFVRKDGTRFAADIRITPTMKGGEQIGYCGVTEALPDVRPEDAMPPISFGTHAMRWLVVTRAPFLSATLVPMLVAAAAVWRRSGTLAWSCFGLALLAGLALNVAANVWNDYFDGVSGTDEANADYFLPFSGGSRAVELGLITPRGQLVLGFAALTVAAGAGLALLATRGPWLLAFGAVGALIAWCYTAPPFRLAARGGLGELSVAVAFGPLLTAGTTFALVGASTLGDWLLGLPVGLLTAAILYVNEFPDAVSDAATGKRHLIVVLGKRTARWGYAALVGLAFAAVAVGAALHLVPATALLALAAAPLAVSATRTVFRHYEDRALVRACARTIQLQAAAGLLLAVGLLLMR